MVQLLNYREVSLSNVVNPVEDLLRGTISNPRFMEIRECEHRKKSTGRFRSSDYPKTLQVGLPRVKTLLWFLLNVMHQQKVGWSAHRWLSNSSKYLQSIGLCYYLLIRRKVLLFTSKNKFECDRTSMGKALVVSAVQWPVLLFAVLGSAWAVAHFRKRTQMSWKDSYTALLLCATFKFQHQHSQLPHRLSLCSIIN